MQIEGICFLHTGWQHYGLDLSYDRRLRCTSIVAISQPTYLILAVNAYEFMTALLRRYNFDIFEIVDFDCGGEESFKFYKNAFFTRATDFQ